MVLESIVKEALSKEISVDKYAEEFGVPKIRVMGCGGAGNNTVNRLAKLGVSGAELLAINTDKQHLSIIDESIKKVLIGKSITRGLGAGGYPEMGAKSAEVSRAALEEALSDTDMLFLCAGMGGGTGTGSAPIVAEIAKEQGAIVIGMVTYPFALERARLAKADEGLKTLADVADTVIVIDNNRLVHLVPNLPMNQAFAVADEVISRAVRGITETITQPSLINLDYADVRSVMSNAGLSMIAVGEAKGVNRVEDAAQSTMENALLDVDWKGAKGALIHITGGQDLTLGEANDLGELVTGDVDTSASVIWGARISPMFEGKIEVIAIMTGVTGAHISGPVSDGMNGSSKGSNDLGLDFIR